MFSFACEVILASASPRRVDLLRTILPEFSVVPANVDEEILVTTDPEKTAKVLALAKAREVSRHYPTALVIGGDTVVVYRQREAHIQLAKPSSQNDAIRMLTELSGRQHQVITGIAIIWPGGERVFSDTTHVTFRKLTQEEIEEYARAGEPMDKAGAYAIQGGAATFVTEISGSINNVIGLPTEALARELATLTP